MGRVNTTSGVVESLPRRASLGYDAPHGKVNTTAVYDEMEEIDAEPEIAFISPANGYVARFKGGHARPLALWVITDDGRFYGVALPEDGRPPLELDNVEDEEGFRKYERKEDK